MSSATTDENTIIFDKSELNYAIRIKKYVEDVLSKKTLAIKTRITLQMKSANINNC